MKRQARKPTQKTSKVYSLIYLSLAFVVAFQLAVTLYQVGKSISYQAQLVQLNKDYQTLSRKKTDLTTQATSKTNLTQAYKLAESEGFIKLSAVAYTPSDQKVALLP